MTELSWRIRDEFDEKVSSFVAQKVRTFRMEVAPEGFFDIEGNPVDWNPLTITLHAENNDIVGVLTGATFFQSLNIKWLWVDESYRNKGYAHQMLLTAIEKSKERGAIFAYGDTWEPLGAYSLFEKLGAELLWRQVFGNGFALLHYRLDF
jgi:GNAT superfamily N-acetyltransferase